MSVLILNFFGQSRMDLMDLAIKFRAVKILRPPLSKQEEEVYDEFDIQDIDYPENDDVDVDFFSYLCAKF